MAMKILQHTLHGDKLACQVCHSVSYTSCDGCHVAISEKTGNPFFETQATYLTFFIGRNPDQNYHRPYNYVTVRHIPVDTPELMPTTVMTCYPTLMPLPTWAYGHSALISSAKRHRTNLAIIAMETLIFS